VVTDGRGGGHQPAGIQPPGFVVPFLADDRATGMHEGQPVTFQALQDETFAPEEAGAQALAETDADPGAICGAEKAVLLADQPATDRCQVARNPGTGVRPGEGHAGLALALIG